MSRLRPNDDFLLRMPPADERVRSLEAMVGIDGVDTEDDNVDVSIQLSNGVVHQRTFMTLANATTLLKRWQQTGESGGGACLPGDGLVFVPRLTESHIQAAVTVILDEDLLV